MEGYTQLMHLCNAEAKISCAAKAIFAYFLLQAIFVLPLPILIDFLDNETSMENIGSYMLH